MNIASHYSGWYFSVHYFLFLFWFRWALLLTRYSIHTKRRGEVGFPEQLPHAVGRRKGDRHECGEVLPLPVAASETWGMAAAVADKLLELSSSTCAAHARQRAAGSAGENEEGGSVTICHSFLCCRSGWMICGLLGGAVDRRPGRGRRRAGAGRRRRSAGALDCGRAATARELCRPPASRSWSQAEAMRS
jgi:hypothetical protein